MSKPDFFYEKKLWRMGFRLVGGCDEVGRGCFAGPVVCACVSFHPDTIYALQGENLKGIKINDSKKLTALQREKASEWIKSNCLSWGVGSGSVLEINKSGIVKATNSAFRRAVNAVNNKLKDRVDYLLTDAFYIPYVRSLEVGNKTTLKAKKESISNPGRSRQLAIIHGDEKSFSIAAASIIAKVYRDLLMKKIGLRRLYKKYDLQNNKGYGTEKHRDAIIKWGMTKYHRKSFVESFLLNRVNRKQKSEPIRTI